MSYINLGVFSEDQHKFSVAYSVLTTTLSSTQFEVVMVSVTWGRFVSIALAGFLLAARMEMSLQSSEPQNKRVNVSLDDSQRVCFSLSGQKGSTGPVGPPGKMGLKGRSGPRGISGSKGPRGKKGSKGDSSVSAITELQTRLAAAEKLISDLVLHENYFDM